MKYRDGMAKALLGAMRDDPKVLVLGEGVADPSGIFGTTSEVSRLFPERVIETPLSENMMTGACLGLALEGWKPIYVHARCDFLMLCMGHLVNTAAKWRSVHGDKGFTFVTRALVGRGWGQGPNHSQALHAMFAHVPGLRVLYLVHPEKLSYWLIEALSCGWPTITLEPRRMYEVEAIDYPMWDQPDVFIITFGDVVLDAAYVARGLKLAGVKAQVYPIEDVSGMSLPEANKPTVVVDTGHIFFGAAAEVVARLAERGNTQIKRVGPPFLALPTSAELERQWYPDAGDILEAVGELLDIRLSLPELAAGSDTRFKGPF
jgi:pyruvate dehydrogenase E1 component beta subunit